MQSLVAQELKKELEQVEILLPRLPSDKLVNPALERRQLLFLNADDAGQLLQRFAGVSLKNYGGLGGLKTISVRGIGGQHTAIVSDGFLLSSTQTGMLDLSQIQAENIEKISLGTALQSEKLLPVSAYLAGNVLEIESFENHFGTDTFYLRSNIRMGSFGQTDFNLSAKYIPSGKRNWLLAAFVKYRQAHGRYPFEIMNGNELYHETRTNNSLNEQYAGFNLVRKGKRAAFAQSTLQYQGVFADRALPGAVILYNPTAHQSLKNQTHRINFLLNQNFNKIDIIHYISYNYNFLNYVDSAYLNIAGFLDEQYFFSTALHGFTLKKSIDSMRIQFYGGAEQQYSILDGSSYLNETPQRYQVKTLLGMAYRFAKTTALVQLGHEWVNDAQLYAKREYQTLTSFIQVRAHNENRFFGLPIFWFKRSFRLPTFSELYFNQFSNKAIVPETANQFNIGSQKTWRKNRLALRFKFDLYYNLVEDKIVVIPTQNLFVWSVQNVGLAQITGLDAELHFSAVFNNKWVFDTRGTYSFQQALDISNKQSGTYRDQLPYIPMHTSNLDITLASTNWGFGILNSYVSSRYALGQNISANLVKEFYLLDLSAFYTLRCKNKQQFKLSVSVKNVFNQSYAYVRYYVMPGRNYLISLSYAL